MTADFSARDLDDGARPSNVGDGAGEELSFEPTRLLEAWIDLPSISGSEHAYVDALEAFFEARDWRVTRQPVRDGRDNLLVSAGAVDELLLVFSTHVDVVPPHFSHRWDGDRIFGRGACDTKGGLVAMIAAAETLRDAHPSGDRIGFLLVVGEEVDHCGAQEARSLPLDGAHIVLCEPTENRLASHQKGLLKVAISARGRAAHSAYPERGKSAIDGLLELLQRVRAEPWPTDDALGATTVNVGLIEGGVAANVIAPSARAVAMFRLAVAADTVLERLREMARETALFDGEIDVLTHIDPQEFHVPSGTWPTTRVAFNSDAVHLKALGPVTLVGPGDIRRAHSEREHLTRTELAAGIALYRRLGASLLDANTGGR